MVNNTFCVRPSCPPNASTLCVRPSNLPGGVGGGTPQVDNPPILNPLEFVIVLVIINKLHVTPNAFDANTVTLIHIFFEFFALGYILSVILYIPRFKAFVCFH